MRVPIILGPTSSGKTSTALEICSTGGAQIISADSRQVVKTLDIGTGKRPVNTELEIQKGEGYWNVNGITIWGYDLVLPNEKFNAFEFATFANKKIAELHRQNIPVIVVGGTGFYIDALTGRISLDAPQSDPVLRQELNAKSLDDLVNQLNQLSPQDLASVDKHNKVRVIRAIERNLVKQSSEKKLPAFKQVEFAYYGLQGTRDVLYSRADLWATETWGQALFDEVKLAIATGYEDSEPLKGIVYKTVTSYLKGELDFESGLARVKFDLHAYIRRQQTWFKKNQTIVWFSLDQKQSLISIIGKTLYNISHG